MSGQCVCGHAEFLHTATSCLKWFLGCNCDVFEADDGTEHGRLVNRNEPYDGIYRGPFKLDFEETL